MLAVGTRYPTIRVLVVVGIFSTVSFISFILTNLLVLSGFQPHRSFFVYQKDRRIALRSPRVNSVYRSTSKLQDYTQIDAIGAD